jgi:hypothetical protein
MTKNNSINSTDNKTPKVFAPSREQKGLSESIWVDYLPDKAGVVVDLGCGWNKLVSPKDGYKVIGVDHVENNIVDVRCDLNGRLPFDDNSVEAVFSQHCIENLKEQVYKQTSYPF